MDEFKEIREALIKAIKEKSDTHEKEVLESQEYKQGINYLHSILKDFIQTLRLISFYSTRAGDIYNDFFSIRMFDEFVESALAISMLSEQGIYNPLKRELRYLIELAVKAVITDYRMMGKTLDEKLIYFQNVVPNSSIEFIDDFNLPFEEEVSQAFKAEIKDFFYKSCAYVHPSKKQFSERINNSEKGNYIGFATAKMLTNNNKLVFRAFDMILTLIFHGFGESMSGDLFIQVLDEQVTWKFHKGKYTKKYSALFDYKSERKSK